MSAYLDELYFDWLYAKVCSVRLKKPSRTYRNLLHLFYIKEYVWLVPNDDNRVEDGTDLRYQFLDSLEIRIDERDVHWLRQGCSFLEFLVAVAQTLDFETDIHTRTWFWELVENIELDHLTDAADIPFDLVDDTLDRVIWRTYAYNGGGGLFPLCYPEKDQREVEIWYQLCAYILERGLV